MSTGNRALRCDQETPAKAVFHTTFFPYKAALPTPLYTGGMRKKLPSIGKRKPLGAAAVIRCNIIVAQITNSVKCRKKERSADMSTNKDIRHGMIDAELSLNELCRKIEERSGEKTSASYFTRALDGRYHSEKSERALREARKILEEINGGMNDERMERDLKELLFIQCMCTRDEVRRLPKKRNFMQDNVQQIATDTGIVARIKCDYYSAVIQGQCEALYTLIYNAGLKDEYEMWLRDNGWDE